jgi:PAS domain-containing protein
LAAALACHPLLAQAKPEWPIGPINVSSIAGAPGLSKPIPDLPAIWTLTFWAEATGCQEGVVPVAGVGTPDLGLFVASRNGAPVLLVNGRVTGSASANKGWHSYSLLKTADAVQLLVDGRPVARAAVSAVAAGATLQIAPPSPGRPAFAGRIAGLRLLAEARSPAALRSDAAAPPPDPRLIEFEPASPHWPLQVRQMQGQVTPQDARTRPTSRTPADAPVAKPVPALPELAPLAPARWQVNGWRLAAAPGVTADGAVLSRAGFDASRWYAATVPGTVLTTLIDRGVYPDPTVGLNNLAIPESLAHQDYWYRTEFTLPADAAGRRLELLFQGVNYRSEMWVNGVRVGTLAGAFARGRFDVGPYLRPGRNAVAVRVSPPDHPGHTHEESLTAGVGENGGVMMLDGPTFGATEGWDWIPTIRDRNTGLWQGVELLARGDVELGDAQVVTTLPKADNSVADVELDIPITNHGSQAVTATVNAAFDDQALSVPVTLAPGETQTLTRHVTVAHPRLWWPNGYGEAALHKLHLSAAVDNRPSDAKDVRFGIRQITYELSLVDGNGALQRVTVDPARARTLGTPIVDHRHEAIRQVPGGWAYSFMAGTEHSPAVTPIAGDEGLSPFLVLRVNGVRIAARGGAIGMDDMLKRVDRARLEPFFRLHRDAHLNIIRNWIGQDTEESFFDLADEYGLLVMNDFWESTQDYNIEAQDVPLFLHNAEEVVKRFRNHPSVAIWFGRNEGVPQPILNEGLARLIDGQDGTRLYMSSSNRISLHDSGPYDWRPPEKYFTEYSNGFAVEVGTPSLPTLEAWQRAIPASEQWPISDSWAYHDWHQTGNGAVKSFTDAMDREYGPPTSLPDLERKAQMLEYESYRAIFEGMNAGLWTRNSGRMLWMTQPAWPSSAWQIFSSDYDTHGAFYGTKKAAEPVHVQMNLPDGAVILVNNRPSPLTGITVRARVVALDGRELAHREARLEAGAGRVTPAFALDLAPLTTNGPVLVRLEAVDAAGTRLSDNFYWRAREDSALRALSALPPATLAATARRRDADGEGRVEVALSNPSATAAIQAKLTLFDAAGKQVLPATFTDNYVSLLPGEQRTVIIAASAGAMGTAPVVRLRGYNVAPASIPVAAP